MFICVFLSSIVSLLLKVFFLFSGMLIISLELVIHLLSEHWLLGVKPRNLVCDLQVRVVIFACPRVRKLLEQGNSLLWGVFEAGNHVRREKVDHLAIRHLFVVKWVDYLKKVFDFFFSVQHAHRLDQVSKLILINYTICVRIDCLEHACELLKEALVLSQLEVKDDLLEVGIQELATLLGGGLQVRLQLLPSKTSALG